MPKNIQFVYPVDTKAVTLSGQGCALNCKHCNKHYLKQMDTLDSSTPENIKSFLISGGLKKDGNSFILDKKKELTDLKKKGNYRFNSHIGFVNPDELNEIVKVVDYVSFDFVSDSKVIKKVYNLDKDSKEYVEQYKLLASKIDTFPHITIGLDEGKIHWEYDAIDILHKLGAKKLVLNVLIPTKNTEFENVKPSDLDEVQKVIKYARMVFKDGTLIIGCMRPGGEYRSKLDQIAVKEGIDRIVKPTPEARKLAEKMGLNISYLYECCVLEPKKEKKDSLRVSTGSAAILDLKKTAIKSKTKTIYLMNPGGCEFDCSFCSQAKNATSKQDKLSRVTWPEYEEDDVFKALSKKEKSYKRICIQVVNTKDIFQTLPEKIKNLRKSAKHTEIAVTIRTYEMKDVDAMFKAGADQVGLCIDIADPFYFQKIKGGNFNFFKNFVIKAGDKYPNKIATHLIVGMGETEKQMVEIMEELHKHHVIIGLFAFTPVPGAKLEFQLPPDLFSYRRIQVALHLIRNNIKRRFKYDTDGRVENFGLEKEILFKNLKDSNVFETSGCRDCNRPYYNERAGARDL
ncbi:MAG: radical SAM protein, partial [Candidatus Gracilibacteria bacterium]